MNNTLTIFIWVKTSRIITTLTYLGDSGGRIPEPSSLRAAPFVSCGYNRDINVISSLAFSLNVYCKSLVSVRFCFEVIKA